METDVLIIGGGLAGTSLACALAASRLRVALVERSEPRETEGWDARVYAVSPANAAFLTRAAAWSRLDVQRLQAVERMSVFGDAGGAIEFSAYDAGIDALAWIAESGRLAAALWDTARHQPNLTLLPGAEPATLEVDVERARLTLSDGRSIDAALIVGADGVQSWVRERIGMQAELKPYGELGVVANFECARAHFGTAFQWFRADGVLAWLPLPGNRISIVWSTPEPHARELLSLDAPEFTRRVMAAGRSSLGDMHCITPAAGFPLRRMAVPDPVRHRVALIGDAAHAVHPLSGHGINLGFQDAKVLAEALLALPDTGDPGDLAVLRRYVRKRAEEVMLVQHVTDALNRLFKPRAWPLALARNAGLSLTGKIPLLRSFMVRYAAGLV